LPFVLVMSSTRLWGNDTVTHQGKPISPFLSWNERHKLLSFERPCQKSTDCDPPLGCLNIDGGGQSFCVASECLTDLQCQDGFTCRVLKSRGDGPLVRYCVPTGSVPEGTLCVEAPANRQGACLPGLICSGWCGRRCLLDDPSSCPQGSFCTDSLNGPLCLPSCTEGTCQAGQHCIRFHDTTSACATVDGEDCQHTPCPEGRKCSFTYSPGQNQVEMECIIPCDEQTPSCPQGDICHWRACRHPCDRNDSTTCEPGERCTEYPVEKISVCQPRRG
jgi:hypothetical protein